MFNLADDLLFVMRSTWPIVAITVVAIVSLRITYIVKNKIAFVLYEEVLTLIFVIYILMFFQVVTYQDVIGNILLFMPYGFFASYYLKLNKKRIAFLLILLVSLAIEGVQLVIGRCFDVDDILLNIIGGMFGYFIYRFLDLITNKMSKRTISTLLIIAIMVLTLVLLYIMM